MCTSPICVYTVMVQNLIFMSWSTRSRARASVGISHWSSLTLYPWDLHFTLSLSAGTSRPWHDNFTACHTFRGNKQCCIVTLVQLMKCWWTVECTSWLQSLCCWQLCLERWSSSWQERIRSSHFYFYPNKMYVCMYDSLLFKKHEPHQNG